ncbi:UDP-2-acetamido-2,6-beta-L-arabino-hexul-4-ose reductase [Chromobacterium amazonense]|uniref:UDP-2-acetamido-2,6-beta-L-arabino-hexul-4-ose reductase n=1 Tax=Chromobacterium amazonense TaxID=1382803 RepID=UPI003F7953D3
MKVLITGANGFLGKNLSLHLSERKDVEVLTFTHDMSEAQLPGLVKDVDFIFHLAGVNRPESSADFTKGNKCLTEKISSAVVDSGRKIPVVYTSSIQAACDNDYGISKLDAENSLFRLKNEHGSAVYIFRLPNVFGKWSRPNYNSVVSTFCHNVSRDLPIQINNPDAALTLVYVDDVIYKFIQLMDGANCDFSQEGFASVSPQYTTTVGALAEQIIAFKNSRSNLITEKVGIGLRRALYSTYLSYLPTEEFSYTVPQHGDERGTFVEMLKTPDCGQFSYFTAHPGVTRGGHYHHSKTEKFLVIKGSAKFKFRQMSTGESYELTTMAEKAEIVETVPGWTHDITNIGNEELIVMLWANEIFDRDKPDTYSCPL